MLPLRGLGETDIGEFVERAWGVRPAGSLVHRLRDMTEGNPFFLHEVLRQMAADGQLAAGAPGGPALFNIPRGVSRIHQAADAAAARRRAPDARRRFGARPRVPGQRAGGRDGEAPDAVIEGLDRAVALELISETRGGADATASAMR